MKLQIKTTRLVRIALLATLGAAWMLAGVPALADSYAQNTPGYRFMADAQRAYRAGQYHGALGKYMAAARWADKLAQHNIGVMYYQGQGTNVDRARAWAWFELSAERHYPQMRAMADQVWEELDQAGQERGRRILENELMPEFGDGVAVPRTARRMDRERRRPVGSRVGSVGAVTVLLPDGTTADGNTYFARERWDYYQVIEREAELFEGFFRGQVRLGEFEVREDDEGGED